MRSVVRDVSQGSGHDDDDNGYGDDYGDRNDRTFINCDSVSGDTDPDIINIRK